MVLKLHRQETVSFRSVKGQALVILRREGGGSDNDDHAPRLFAGIDISRDLATAAALDEARAYDDTAHLVP